MAADPKEAALPLTRAGAVAQRLRELILSGEIEPGARLRQAEIADRFGVSTTPVREAFVSLAREGLVRRDTHRGVVVFAPSADELSEIYEIRSVVEPLATRIAAKQMTSERLDQLDRIVKQMRTANPTRYLELNHELHSLIYTAAERPRLMGIIENLREAASRYLAMATRLEDPDYSEQVQREHEEIVEQLRSGSPSKASRLVREHLENSAVQVLKVIK